MGSPDGGAHSPCQARPPTSWATASPGPGHRPAYLGCAVLAHLSKAVTDPTFSGVLWEEPCPARHKATKGSARGPGGTGVWDGAGGGRSTPRLSFAPHRGGQGSRPALGCRHRRAQGSELHSEAETGRQALPDARPRPCSGLVPPTAAPAAGSRWPSHAHTRVLGGRADRVRGACPPGGPHLLQGSLNISSLPVFPKAGDSVVGTVSHTGACPSASRAPGDRDGGKYAPWWDNAHSLGLRGAALTLALS